MIFVYGLLTVGVFIAGKQYGARVEKEAVTLSLAAFTYAKTKLMAAITKAQAEAKAEVARLEAVASKYL